MIIIKKSTNNQFFHVVTGNNHEPLVDMETVPAKQEVWKNLFAIAEQFGPVAYARFIVKDETTKKPQLWLVQTVKDGHTRKWVKKPITKTKRSKL